MLNLTLFMCLFLQHDSNWRQLSFCCFVGLHKGCIVGICLVLGCVFHSIIVVISSISKFKDLCNLCIGDLMSIQ